MTTQTEYGATNEYVSVQVRDGDLLQVFVLIQDLFNSRPTRVHYRTGNLGKGGQLLKGSHFFPKLYSTHTYRSGIPKDFS